MNYLGTYKSKLSIMLGIIVFSFPKFCSFMERFQSENTGFRGKKNHFWQNIFGKHVQLVAVSTYLEKNKMFQFLRNASCLF